MGDFDVDNFEQVFQDLEYQTWIMVSNLVDFKDRILKNEHERILREGVTEYEVKKLIAMTRKMDAIKDNFVDIGLIVINHNPAIEEALRD